MAAHLHIRIDEYDERIRTFIPRYEEMLDEAAAAALAAAARPLETVLDLGIGTGALAARILARCSRARIVGIDADPGMLALAARRLPARRTTLMAGSFLRVPPPRCDAIVASFALHHVAHRRTKAALYRRLAAALRRGGVLVTADCHPPGTRRLAAAGHAAWRDHLAATYGPRQAERFLRAWSREDVYVPLDEELALLRGAGLAPDVTWRHGSFAVIAAHGR